LNEREEWMRTVFPDLPSVEALDLVRGRRERIFFPFDMFYDLPHLFDPTNPTASLFLFSLAVSWK
jgi:hypothetical protein